MLGKVEICGVNTSKLKTLKNEEMMELLRRSKQGDEDARQRLVEGNLRKKKKVINNKRMRQNVLFVKQFDIMSNHMEYITKIYL